jgi:hypothetical protein
MMQAQNSETTAANKKHPIATHGSEFVAKIELNIQPPSSPWWGIDTHRTEPPLFHPTYGYEF